MIQLRFNTMAQRNPIVVGPAESFRIDGPRLFKEPGDELVGVYWNQHWQTSGHHVSSYECSDRVYVHGENREQGASQRYGPFDELRFPNGSCYAGRERLAEFVEETEYWRLRPSDAQWPILVITPANR